MNKISDHLKITFKPRRRIAVYKSLSRLLLMLLFLLSAAAWRGQLFGLKTDGTAKSGSELILKVEECYLFFPDAASIDKLNADQFHLYNARKKFLGRALWYRGEQGYGGRVPVYIFTDTHDTIKGVLPGKHYESSDYLTDISLSGFLAQWNGTVRADATAKEVDIVSGATITSQAIISGIKSVSSGHRIIPPFNPLTMENIISFLLLIVLVFAFFNPKWFMRFRTVLLIATVIIFGFWITQFMSFAQIVNWISGGINWRMQTVAAFILLLSVLFPVLFGKAFYCTWVCPYGAAQELCGKVGSKKAKIPPRVSKIIKYSREAIFIIIMIILWTGFAVDLTLIEPFSAFSVTKAGYWVLGLAVFFLLLSLFIPKAWCRYCCPTGYILDWLR